MIYIILNIYTFNNISQKTNNMVNTFMLFNHDDGWLKETFLQIISP